jgi:hypothetical protein
MRLVDGDLVVTLVTQRGNRACKNNRQVWISFNYEDISQATGGLDLADLDLSESIGFRFKPIREVLTVRFEHAVHSVLCLSKTKLLASIV